MSKQRADLGFGSALDDLGNFGPKPQKTIRPKTATEETKAVAEASGFKSREPVAKLQPKEIRRRRTGRNAQFNIKARPETIQAYCDIADANGWGLGETLEYAVELLQKERSKQ